MSNEHVEFRPNPHGDSFAVCFRNFKIAEYSFEDGKLLNRSISRLWNLYTMCLHFCIPSFSWQIAAPTSGRDAIPYCYPEEGDPTKDPDGARRVYQENEPCAEGTHRAQKNSPGFPGELSAYAVPAQ